MLIKINEVKKANRYLPRKLLKFKLSFLNSAFKNFIAALRAKNDMNMYIRVLITRQGATYKTLAKTPFNLYFNKIVPSVTPRVNPLKKMIIITANKPIMEIPNINIKSSWSELFNISGNTTFIPKTLSFNLLILLKYEVTWFISIVLSSLLTKLINKDPKTSPKIKSIIIKVNKILSFFIVSNK